MFDFEFLQKAKPSIKKVIVYETVHKIFFNSVLDKISDLLKSKVATKEEIRERGNFSAIHSGSLFGASLIFIYVDDLIDRDKKWKDSLVSNAPALIDKEFENYVVLIVNPVESEKLLEVEEYKQIKANATFLEEPANLTKSSASKVAKHLIQASAGQPIDMSAIKNLSQFEEALSELYAVDEPSLPDFLKGLDKVVLTCVDLTTMDFDLPKFRSLLGTQTKSVFFEEHKLLGKFLQSPDENYLKFLIQHLDRQFSQDKLLNREIYRRLMTALHDLMVCHPMNNMSKAPDGMSPYKYNQISEIAATIPANTLIKANVRMAAACQRIQTSEANIVDLLYPTFQLFLKK